jgi:hypothetical protein
VELWGGTSAGVGTGSLLGDGLQSLVAHPIERDGFLLKQPHHLLIYPLISHPLAGRLLFTHFFQQHNSQL